MTSTSSGKTTLRTAFATQRASAPGPGSSTALTLPVAAMVKVTLTVVLSDGWRPSSSV